MNDSTSDTIKVDTARLPLLLRELRLPTIAAMWQSFTERADREGWPAARLLATLTELELAERDQRRIQRHLLEARLPPGKTLDSFDFTAVPMLSRAHVAALATGDGWIDRGGTILLFGPSGSGKSHLSAAFGHALIENGYRVLFIPPPISCSACNRPGRLCCWRARSRSSTNTTCSFSRTSATCERIRQKPQFCSS
jgi:DNA replication protein DnaC